MSKNRQPPYELALVMTGGGARAAYQVGFLCCLAGHFPDLQIPIITGVSAGAINAAYLANQCGSFSSAVGSLRKLWEGLSTDQIYRFDTRKMITNLAQLLGRLTMRNLVPVPSIHGYLDTTPLKSFLAKNLHQGACLMGIDDNIRSGQLTTCALTATNYSNGQSMTWFSGRGIDSWQRPARNSQRVVFDVDHVMASAAIPLVFPAVRVGDSWYGDGGIGMATPLAPALHLRADRILAISTKNPRIESRWGRRSASCYPPTVQVAGVLMNAIFLDALDQDALTLERINGLVRRLPARKRGGLREVRLFVMRPSVDLAKLAAEYERRFAWALKFITRSLGARGGRGSQWLSMIMFEPDYIHRMIEIGQQDAEEHKEEIRAFLEEE